MKNNKIIDVYNNINPDNESKERMYANILNSSTEHIRTNDSTDISKKADPSIEMSKPLKNNPVNTSDNYVIDFSTNKHHRKKLIIFAGSIAAVLLIAIVLLAGSNLLSPDEIESASLDGITDINDNITTGDSSDDNNSNFDNIDDIGDTEESETDVNTTSNADSNSSEPNTVKINTSIVYNSSAMNLSLTVINDLSSTISFGENYYLEKKSNSDWSIVSPISEYSYNDIAHEVEAGDNYSAGDLELEKIYGKLNDGNYRISLQYFVAPYVDSRKLIMYGEFTIGESDNNDSYNVNKNTNNVNDTYVSINDANLTSTSASTTVLVRYNGMLFGKSNCSIDCASSGEPIDTIDSLVDSSYVPAKDKETNTQILLNSKVYSCDEASLVLFYDSEFVLFNKINY